MPIDSSLLQRIANNDPNLKQIILNNQVPALIDSDIIILARALTTNNTVESINLNDNNITDTGIQTLALSLIYKTNVKELIVSCNPFGDVGAEALAQLRSLTYLSAAGTHIGDRGAEALAANTTLKKLELYATSIGDEGAYAFVINTTLELLDLRETQVTNTGAGYFFQAVQNSAYIVINVSGKHVDQWVQERINIEIAIRNYRNYMQTQQVQQQMHAPYLPRNWQPIPTIIPSPFTPIPMEIQKLQQQQQLIQQLRQQQIQQLQQQVNPVVTSSPVSAMPFTPPISASVHGYMKTGEGIPYSPAQLAGQRGQFAHPTARSMSPTWRPVNNNNYDRNNNNSNATTYTSQF